jgi:hypothetical protein
MISTKDLANMSVLDLAQMIETRRQETVLIYQAIAAKITKKSLGTAFLKANKLASAEYYLQVAKDHPEILAPTFDVNHFEEVILFFKTMQDTMLQDGNTAVILKAPRDSASQDCFWSVSYIRRRVQELQANPIFKLILQKEPNPRESYTRSTPQS